MKNTKFRGLDSVLIMILALGLFLGIVALVFYSKGDIENASIDTINNSSFLSGEIQDSVQYNEPIFTINESHSLLKNGEVILEDLSRLKGYPNNGNDKMISVHLWGESTDENILGFSLHPAGGGLFYFPLYILNLSKSEKEFQKIEDISVYPYSSNIVSPDRSKIIGLFLDNEILLDNRDVYHGPSDDNLYYYDLNSLQIVKFFSNDSESETVFFLGFIGEDPLMAEWMNNDEIILNMWDKELFQSEYGSLYIDVTYDQATEFGREIIIDTSDLSLVGDSIIE